MTIMKAIYMPCLWCNLDQWVTICCNVMIMVYQTRAVAICPFDMGVKAVYWPQSFRAWYRWIFYFLGKCNLGMECSKKQMLKSKGLTYHSNHSFDVWYFLDWFTLALLCVPMDTSGCQALGPHQVHQSCICGVVVIFILWTWSPKQKLERTVVTVVAVIIH